MTRPDTLYHYTNASGFTNILKGSELWATDARFLNDAEELKYAWDEFKSTLSERAAQDSQHSEAYAAQLDAIEGVKAENLDLMEIRVFTTSLTELSDDVPQWRSYAADGHGVALGFNTESILMLKVPYYNHTATGDLVPMLAANTKEHVTWGATLGKVGYGTDARAEAISQELWQIEQVCGTNDVGNRSQKTFNCIHRIPIQLSNLGLVKHEGFKSEQEWRLTIPEHLPSTSASQLSALNELEGFPTFLGFPLTTVNVQFREGGSALFKPYTALPFEKSALVEVVLGPNINAELAGPPTRRLLDRHGFQHTQIVPSALPYRT